MRKTWVVGTVVAGILLAGCGGGTVSSTPPIRVVSTATRAASASTSSSPVNTLLTASTAMTVTDDPANRVVAIAFVKSLFTGDKTLYESLAVPMIQTMDPQYHAFNLTAMPSVTKDQARADGVTSYWVSANAKNSQGQLLSYTFVVNVQPDHRVQFYGSTLDAQ